jgi:hypothetical protein
MFNVGDQIVNIAYQLIKFSIDVGALVIKKPHKLVLGHALIEVRRGLHLFPDMVRRQQKTTSKNYPYQLATTG